MAKLRDIPSLDFLKGFDAAARHLSFTQAAAEMFLTQSATPEEASHVVQSIHGRRPSGSSRCSTT